MLVRRGGRLLGAADALTPAPTAPAATGARFQPKCEGQMSPLGEIVRIGADASGLMVSHTQQTGRHAL